MGKKYFLYVLAFAMTTANATNPASKEWVLQQIAANPQQLTSADWNAICTSGSVTSSNGCYGNVTSAAFVKVSDYIGGFTRYANINPQNIPSSVFVKAFFGGTNIPAQATNLNLTVNGGAARCALFTRNGYGIGPAGVNSSVPTSGSDSGAFVPPMTLTVESINNANNGFPYNSFPSSSPTVGGPPSTDPMYLLCVGYNATDGSTATSVNVTAT